MTSPHGLPAGSLIIHDTSPISAGSSAKDTLLNSIDLAQHGAAYGYRRYWTAETHGMRAVASCSPAVVCGQAAAQTSDIRIGAGGVLLPNHSPLVVSEQFGALEAFFPGRIDLAIGRAPGGPAAATTAINPHRSSDPAAFADQIGKLRAYFRCEYVDKARSVTGYGNEPELWVLGTNPDSAALAAQLQLPYAFGGHLHLDATAEAVETYRSATAGATDWTPRLAVSVGVIAADTGDQAEHLAGSHRLKVMRRKTRGERLFLPAPELADAEPPATPDETRAFEQATEGYIIGSGEAVRRDLASFQERTTADEVIISSPIYDHAARLRSYALAAGVAPGL